MLPASLSSQAARPGGESSFPGCSFPSAPGFRAGRGLAANCKGWVIFGRSSVQFRWITAPGGRIFTALSENPRKEVFANSCQNPYPGKKQPIRSLQPYCHKSGWAEPIFGRVMGALQDFALDQTFEGNDVALGIGTLTQADEGARKEPIQAMGRGSELPHPPGCGSKSVRRSRSI